MFALLFAEAWSELCGGDDEGLIYELLSLKMWMLAPKEEGANQVIKLRDLELGNKCRQTLARMLFKVPGKVRKDRMTGLAAAQQAVTGAVK